VTYKLTRLYADILDKNPMIIVASSFTYLVFEPKEMVVPLLSKQLSS